MNSSAVTLHVHCIGIGGIGVSGIALILAARNYQVSGCDGDSSPENSYLLQSHNIQLSLGHNTSLCHDPSISIIVHSSAISSSHPELLRARTRGIPVFTRAQMLAYLMRNYSVIAVAGSHGKTTTSALMAHILIIAGYNPSYVIGGYLNNTGTNAYHSESNWYVVEADESDRSLITLNPAYAILTNVSREHLDTYNNLEDIIATYHAFLSNVVEPKNILLCADNFHTHFLSQQFSNSSLYGIENNNVHIRASSVDLQPTCSHFIIETETEKTPCTLSLPGTHNILNALAAISVARRIGIGWTAITEACASFKGVERRFTYRGQFFNGIECFDDYGHHPHEIKHTLSVARRRAKNKLIVVFQPHRFSRTYHLWDEFIEVLSNRAIDYLIITDIHAASEVSISTISSQHMVETLLSRRLAETTFYAPYCKKGATIIDTIAKVGQTNDLLLLLGAGKLYTLTSYFPS
jgi:UDP-N-acetylmuramate--alanine ligase